MLPCQGEVKQFRGKQVCECLRVKQLNLVARSNVEIATICAVCKGTSAGFFPHMLWVLTVPFGNPTRIPYKRPLLAIAEKLRTLMSDEQVREIFRKGVIEQRQYETNCIDEIVEVASELRL